jgi:uncharacterized NAD-dependent epimerase/dehydratase family protein
VRPSAARAGGAEGEPVIPPLPEVIEAYESAARWVSEGRVAAIALNTWSLAEPLARRALEEAARATGRPALDPVREGVEALVDAVSAAAVARGGLRATRR